MNFILVAAQRADFADRGFRFPQKPPRLFELNSPQLLRYGPAQRVPEMALQQPRRTACGLGHLGRRGAAFAMLADEVESNVHQTRRSLEVARRKALDEAAKTVGAQRRGGVGGCFSGSGPGGWGWRQISIVSAFAARRNPAGAQHFVEKAHGLVTGALEVRLDARQRRRRLLAEVFLVVHGQDLQRFRDGDAGEAAGVEDGCRPEVGRHEHAARLRQRLQPGQKRGAVASQGDAGWIDENGRCLQSAFRKRGAECVATLDGPDEVVQLPDKPEVAQVSALEETRGHPPHGHVVARHPHARHGILAANVFRRDVEQHLRPNTRRSGL